MNLRIVPREADETKSIVKAAVEKYREAHPTVVLTHFVQWDDPSATSKRLQQTVCGAWVRPCEVVLQRQEITCPECATTMERFDAVEIER